MHAVPITDRQTPQSTVKNIEIVSTEISKEKIAIHEKTPAPNNNMRKTILKSHFPTSLLKRDPITNPTDLKKNSIE